MLHVYFFLNAISLHPSVMFYIFGMTFGNYVNLAYLFFQFHCRHIVAEHSLLMGRLLTDDQLYLIKINEKNSHCQNVIDI